MKNLETERYLLRKPRMEDSEDIYEKWGKDTEKTAEYGNCCAHKNIIETKAFLKTAINEAEFGTPSWFIEEKQTNVVIGYVEVFVCSEKNKNCEIIFYFLENWRTDFSPEEVLTEIIKYLFTDEIFDTIVVKFYDRSEEDTKFFETILTNIGMKKEGTLRNRMIDSNGQKINRIVYSILKEEFVSK